MYPHMSGFKEKTPVFSFDGRMNQVRAIPTQLHQPLGLNKLMYLCTLYNVCTYLSYTQLNSTVKHA